MIITDWLHTGFNSLLYTLYINKNLQTEFSLYYTRLIQWW
jgi:hypothetical protein